MGNVKVGDKVRSLVTQIDVRAGGLYEVKTVDGGDVWVIDDVGDNWYLASDEFEILPVAAKAPEDKTAFKVGDRVRALQDSGLGAFLAGKEYEVLAVTDERITAINERGQRDIWGEHYFELVPVAKVPEDQPALKIEAGKYYRTRDGRKVGPMEAWCFGGWHSDRAEYPLNGGVWLDDGTAKYAGAKDSHDLIAEWVDVSVKAAAPFPFILRNLEFSFVPVAKPAIVALIENAQPKPSAAPHVHANETFAAREAARLAGIHKGQEFGVYVLTQKVSEPAPSYKHEWQRFAAKGEKILAIRELRSVTGLGLKAAKDAVEHWIAHDEPYSRIAA